MWSTTGPRLDWASFSLKLLTSSWSRSANFQPRGFRVNTWNASQPSSLARSTAWSMEPEIETCTPTFKPLIYQLECWRVSGVHSFGSRKTIPEESRGWNRGVEEALNCFRCWLERGSCVPVLVEDLTLVHAHEPVESHDEHQPNDEHYVVGVCAKAIVDPLSCGVAEF